MYSMSKIVQCNKSFFAILMFLYPKVSKLKWPVFYFAMQIERQDMQIEIS